MPYSTRLILVVLFLFFGSLIGAAPCIASEDQVILANGDRITGTIKRIWDGELFIEPAYADEFALELSAVDRIVSDRRFEFELGGEQKIVGRLEIDPSGSMTLVTDSGREELALVDIEELEELSEGWDWAIRTDLSVNGSEGNSNDSQLTWQSYGRLEIEDQRHELDFRIDRASRDGETSQDRTRANYLYSWFMTDQWFLQAGIGGERDPVRDLDRRVSAGGGLGYQFFDDAHRKLEFTVSAVGIDEELGGVSNRSLAARWGAKYRQELLAGNLEFFHDHSLWAYVSGRDTTLIKTSTGFRWDVWADIYFNTQIDWDYETDPAQGAENEDIRYSVGLGVELD